jgi:hypothetical protein
MARLLESAKGMNTSRNYLVEVALADLNKHPKDGLLALVAVAHVAVP